MTSIDKHAPGSICWVDLMTSDGEKARAFYTSLLGWTFLVGGPESGHYAMAKKGERNVAGVGQPPPGSTYPAAWTPYFATENLDATIEKVTANGGTVNMGAMDVMEEGRLAVCTDPTGAIFGVWQPKRHTGAQLVSEPGAMAWHEVATRDAARARDFYSAVFGLESKKLEASESMPTDYYMLNRGSARIAGVMQMTKEWDGIPPVWSTYFAVEDCDASAKRVTELGGKIMVPPFDMPYGRMSVVTDPTGATFVIVKMKN